GRGRLVELASIKAIDALPVKAFWKECSTTQRRCWPGLAASASECLPCFRSSSAKTCEARQFEMIFRMAMASEVRERSSLGTSREHYRLPTLETPLPGPSNNSAGNAPERVHPSQPRQSGVPINSL